MKTWFAELACLPHIAKKVVIQTDGDRITAVQANVGPPPDAIRLPGLVLPGLANVHSHAFQRALRGRTHGGAGDFWTWRERMYQAAAQIEPKSYFELARATFAEMALAGITAVGEFHYLHHSKSGQHYPDPNAMGDALLNAARDAGIRITLLDTCYLWAGLGNKPLQGTQCCFSDGDVAAWISRVEKLQPSATAKIGAAIHSVRAVDESSMKRVAEWAQTRGAPLHYHLSEQRQENEQCLTATGKTPTELLSSIGAVGPGSTAVHATHLTDDDIEILGKSGTSICFCPTTERDLGDGMGPAAALQAAGSRLCVGSDSQAVIDAFEEIRLIEYHQRLQTGKRGLHGPRDLLAAATRNGMQALGWNAGVLEPGALADFISVRLDSPRMAGTDAGCAVEQIVFAATAADVSDVVVGGEFVVQNGRHLRIGDVSGALARAIKAVS
jgi:formiminoglutamate deiminase